MEVTLDCDCMICDEDTKGDYRKRIWNTGEYRSIGKERYLKLREKHSDCVGLKTPKGLVEVEA